MTNPNLAALSEAATKGPWAVCTDATGDTFIASMTDSTETICDFGAGCDDDAQESLNTDATFIVTLVTLYRSGDLVLIDREGMRERAAAKIMAVLDDEGFIDPEWTGSGDICSKAADAAIAAMLGDVT